ncbi:Acetyltransferase (GNAT) family protein [Thalassoglobus neptunius]|uniref:Acetyltransferase (GNAT) family protein n=1 Tax=Thalassoglobus neptunius TaxID=1938619 RepID=A0A5C5WPX3_9PLAN|nr:GNAT family N-acetyltransferase [Thalassoglobus neptunius]TWT52171.1 Acetyltransferase (GNAT) family protein [Thalassoglobus neptunius]
MSELISFQRETDLGVDEFHDLLVRSTLGDRRPLSDPNRLQGMLENADILVSARTQNQRLVGIARSITDYSFCTYLSDLAVDAEYQKQGIGKELIRQTRLASGLDVRLILLSAPQAVDYYPHIGFEKHDSCWTISPEAK